MRASKKLKQNLEDRDFCRKFPPTKNTEKEINSSQAIRKLRAFCVPIIHVCNAFILIYTYYVQYVKLQA